MIAKLILSSAAILITASLMSSVDITPWWVAAIVAIVLGIINTIIKPIIKFLSLPINIITLGLFSFVINGMMVLLCSNILSNNFKVSSLGAAIVFSIILSIVNWIINKMFDRDKDKE